MIATWHAPLGNGKTGEEMVVSFDQKRERRVLIAPPLFDEANKMRRFVLQMMRALNRGGADSFLPDLPGCNESLAPLRDQTLAHWLTGMEAAADQVSATHVFSLRAGALVAPPSLPGWQYAPQSGAKLLRGLLRARTIAAREAGRREEMADLMAAGRSEGLILAGWPIGRAMFGELETAEPACSDLQAVVSQNDIGGAGLWLRAEPGENEAQAQALAQIILGSQATTP